MTLPFLLDFATVLIYIKWKMLSKLKKARKGATAIEYAIIASLLSVVIIVGLEATGVALGDNYNAASAKLEDAYEAAAGGDNAGGDNGGTSPNLQGSPDEL